MRILLGLSREDLMRVVPGIAGAIARYLVVSAGAGAGVRKAEANATLQLVAIPLLRTAAASTGEEGNGHEMQPDAPVERMIAAPKDWCTDPPTTSCLRVRGNSMSPLIQDGYILTVDFSQNDVQAIDGKIVIARRKTWD